MLNPKHIFLTGFMGSGKSTHGRRLANTMGLEFVDLDAYIEQRGQESIAHIFEAKGEDGFRKMETHCLDEVLLDHKEPAVIALGGGTICFHNNLEKVKQNGLLVYLELSPAAIHARVSQGRGNRPLLKNVPPGELLQNIEQRLEARKKYYGQAHLSLNGLNLTTQQLYSAIIAFREKNSI